MEMRRRYVGIGISAKTHIFMIHVQTTTVDIPDDDLDQSKTLDMGFLHALLGTSEI